MLTLMVTVLLLMVFGKILEVGMRTAWGITKLVFSVEFLPLILIFLAFGGLIGIALPVLIIVGFAVFLKEILANC